MLNVYLTDLHKQVTADLGRGAKDIALVMALKKVFLSTTDLLEPVIPENQDINQISWRATQADLITFERLAKSWQALELRLQAYSVFSSDDAMALIVQAAQQQRQARYVEQDVAANLVELDILLLFAIHQQLDQLLSKEPAYAHQFLQNWPEFKDAVKS